MDLKYKTDAEEIAALQEENRRLRGALKDMLTWFGSSIVPYLVEKAEKALGGK